MSIRAGAQATRAAWSSIVRSFTNHHLDWRESAERSGEGCVRQTFIHSMASFDDNADRPRSRMGPIDFQVRETCFSAVLPGCAAPMKAIELQIHPGIHRTAKTSLFFWFPMWKQVLDFDMARGRRIDGGERSG